MKKFFETIFGIILIAAIAKELFSIGGNTGAEKAEAPKATKTVSQPKERPVLPSYLLGLADDFLLQQMKRSGAATPQCSNEQVGKVLYFACWDARRGKSAYTAIFAVDDDLPGNLKIYPLNGEAVAVGDTSGPLRLTGATTARFLRPSPANADISAARRAFGIELERVRNTSLPGSH